MYSPNLFPKDLYMLWNHEETNKTLRSQEPINQGSSQHQSRHTSTSNQNTRSTNEQVLADQRKYLRSLFAPPLSAYTAEYPGASSLQLDYIIQSTSSMTGFTPSTGASILTTTPLAQSKVEQLERIRNTGYTTIRPIGIDRTMEEIDYDDAGHFNVSEQQYDDPSYVNTAENTHTGTGVNGSSNLSLSQQMEVIGGEESREAEVVFDGEVSLSEDDGLEEEDDDPLFESTEPEEESLRRHSRFRLPSEEPGYRDSLEDEGFMADEVEYQDDHSLNADTNQYMFINSGASSTTVTSANLNSGRTVITNPTSFSSPLQTSVNQSANAFSLNRIDEIQDENEQDHSDLDMVVDAD
ncbi:Apc15p protein-domain-containing protein [Scheffersomyces xylosifermentans]|uniref:Apc15p protein-domain-containing protein n=1 Tax=Scheffersomyces xylosifermentans TaxID=1304137 RepID=UPI00315DC75D